MKILVIDVGTSSMRGTVMDESGRMCSSGQVLYQPVFYPDGRVEQDSSDWVGALLELCAAASAQSDGIEAVAVTAQRSSVILTDPAGNALLPAIMWQDTRTMGICEALSEETDRIRAHCGADVNPVFSASKMAWLKQNRPDLTSRPHRFLVIIDLLLHEMTGNFVTDVTYGSRSLLMNLQQEAWDPELLALFGIEEEELCRLIPVGSAAGTLTADFASRSGLKAGIPVISCGGDQQCAALGQGMTSPGQMTLNLGTGAYILRMQESSGLQVPSGMICGAAAVPGLYVLECSLPTCGVAFDWALREIGSGRKASDIDQVLDASPMGANGVTVLPDFRGAASGPDAVLQGAVFSGITLGTSQEDLLRGLVEGICCEIRRQMLKMEKGSEHPDLEQEKLSSEDPSDRYIRVGGGMAKSDGICQTLSDILERPLLRKDSADATTKGAWIGAAAALGLYENAAEAAQVFADAKERVFYPRTGSAECCHMLTARSDRLREMAG